MHRTPPQLSCSPGDPPTCRFFTPTHNRRKHPTTYSALRVGQRFEGDAILQSLLFPCSMAKPRPKATPNAGLSLHSRIPISNEDGTW
jgi:hypothetical protein